MSSKTSQKRIYKVIFLSQGKVYELYARHVHQGNMYGFIEVEELIFGEKSSLLVDPTEERLQGEFAGVRRSFIPIHAIVRIDEVEKEGASKVRPTGESAGNIAVFSAHPPPGKGREEGD